MLEIKKINKSYKTGSFTQHALKDISLKFRKKEFVCILGPSGSGKTTLLNIIGGLDRYDSGDLIINNSSTKKFKDKDWDAYRNNCIGFIFQNYNLISHITILDNIEMAMTLSGVSKNEKKRKAKEALKKVGLLEHAHKRPNQLSGGQMQRVAIARALANDPDIILADEPTGALDSKTSIQIMSLIKEISKEKLVIMVTHNKDLAEEYSNRIISLKDGELINDTNPVSKEEAETESFNIKKTAMSFFTALNLSFNNIRTKKGRTALTAFASSIGIIGIALILSLSNGFQIKIDEFQKESLAEYPIIISTSAMSMNTETMLKYQEKTNKLKKYSNKELLYPQDDMMSLMTHKNNITKDYMEYLKKLNTTYYSAYMYTRATALNIIGKNNANEYVKINTGDNSMSSMSSFSAWYQLPAKSNPSNNFGIVEENYDTLKGNIKDSDIGLVIQVDSKNQISKNILKQLGYTGDEKNITFDDIMSKELKVILNNEYYQEVNSYYIPNSSLADMYNNENALTLKVVAIIRGKESSKTVSDSSSIFYTEGLINKVIEENSKSNIVKAQESKDYSILTGQDFDNSKDSVNTRDNTLGYLGADTVPSIIMLYPKDFKAKDKITAYLNKYNDNKSEEDAIEYTDQAAMISSLTGNIMDAITIVLIAFSSISLIVSSIMIGIITYISVLERTKEIGILRALGARKKDIKRVFNAETFIIGLFSGILGIAIALLLTIPANIIIESLSDLPNVAKLNPVHAIILITISVLLTVIAGSIPARIASKKDPVESLKAE